MFSRPRVTPNASPSCDMGYNYGQLSLVSISFPVNFQESPTPDTLQTYLIRLFSPITSGIDPFVLGRRRSPPMLSGTSSYQLTECPVIFQRDQHSSIPNFSRHSQLPSCRDKFSLITGTLSKLNSPDKGRHHEHICGSSSSTSTSH